MVLALGAVEHFNPGNAFIQAEGFFTSHPTRYHLRQAGVEEQLHLGRPAMIRTEFLRRRCHQSRQQLRIRRFIGLALSWRYEEQSFVSEMMR